MIDEPKFCKDCKHFQERGGIFYGVSLTWPDSCTQPPYREPIRGNKIGADPARMRSEQGACKPEALLWEEKPAPAPSPVSAPTPAPTAEVPIRFMAHFGSAESDERYIERDGWLQHQSRRVLRDTAGVITERGEWADCGGRMKLPDLPAPTRWWEFWK